MRGLKPTPTFGKSLRDCQNPRLSRSVSSVCSVVDYLLCAWVSLFKLTPWLQAMPVPVLTFYTPTMFAIDSQAAKLIIEFGSARPCEAVLPGQKCTSVTVPRSLPQ